MAGEAKTRGEGWNETDRLNGKQRNVNSITAMTQTADDDLQFSILPYTKWVEYELQKEIGRKGWPYKNEDLLDRSNNVKLKCAMTVGTRKIFRVFSSLFLPFFPPEYMRNLRVACNYQVYRRHVYQKDLDIPIDIVPWLNSPNS